MSELDQQSEVLDVVQPTTYAAAVLEFLADEGFRPKLDETGDVMFRCEGNQLYIRTHDGDGTYFQMVFLPFWPIEDAAERLRVHEAAAQTHVLLKVGRLMVLEADVMADVAAYLPDDQTWRQIFFRSLSALQALIRTFRDQMHAQLEN